MMTRTLLGILLLASLGCAGAPEPQPAPPTSPTAATCNCALVCLCRGTEPSPEQIEASQRATVACEEAGTPCECPICAAP